VIAQSPIGQRPNRPHGAGQRMQCIRVTDSAKACLRGVGASLPPLGSGAAVPVYVTSFIPSNMRGIPRSTPQKPAHGF